MGVNLSPVEIFRRDRPTVPIQLALHNNTMQILCARNILAGTNLVFSFRKEITGCNRKTSASESFPGNFLLGIFPLVHRYPLFAHFAEHS